MKRLNEITKELREQVEEVTDPRDPSKLKKYTESLRDGMESVISLLPDDPTLAALALYGQVKVVKPKEIAVIAERGFVISDDWIVVVKPAILVRPEAHAMMKVIEDAKLGEILAAAVVANFSLATIAKNKNAEKEESEQYESI